MVRRSVSLNADTNGSTNNGLHVRNTRRIQTLLRRLGTNSGDNATFTAVVLGSSMTLGVGVGGPSRAWSSLLAREMANKSHASVVQVVNKAKGGTTSTWALLRLDSLLVDGVDLVIVDYDVTDCYAMSDSPDDRAYHAATTELLVRRLLTNPRYSPAVLVVHVAVTNSGSWAALDKARQRCYHLMDNAWRVNTLRAYGVPIVSQKLAMWEHFDCPLSEHWPCTEGCNHPGPPAHSLLARLVAAFLLNSTSSSFSPAELGKNDDSLSSSSSRPSSNIYFNDGARVLDDQFCKQMHTGIDGQVPVYTGDVGGDFTVTDARLGLNVTYHTCWGHREDVKGKPGLIAENCHANRSSASDSDSLYFPVQYGASPRLVVTFLRTYTSDTGVVNVSFVPLTRALPPIASSHGAHLSHLPWQHLVALDPLRVSDDGYSRASLTWTNVYAPQRDNSTSRDMKYAILTTVPNAFTPYTSYLIRLQQVDANAAAPYSPRHVLRSSHQKFKLFFVSYC